METNALQPVTPQSGGATTHAEAPRADLPRRPKVVLLSSQLLTDRMFVYNRALATLAQHTDLAIWTTAADQPEYRRACREIEAQLAPFPEVGPFPERLNLLRRLNDFAWDFGLSADSRLSLDRHVRRRHQQKLVRMLRGPARAVAWLRGETAFERWLERRLLGYARSPEASERLASARPDLVVTTAPFQFLEPAVAAAAIGLGIPVLAFIPSWDNPTTKTRLVFRYDGYAVWSEQMRRHLLDRVPHSRHAPVYVTGAPQFDLFFDRAYLRSRRACARSWGLDPNRPIILYCLGSPNFLPEHHGAIALARRLVAGNLGAAQLLIRPHPQFDDGSLVDMVRPFGPRVAVQRTQGRAVRGSARFQTAEQVVEWVNSFRHADVVVNLASTATIDAAVCDRPVVSLDYDPSPGAPRQELVRDINHRWSHFRPVAESGGVWLSRSLAETVEAVRAYLRTPTLHQRGRRWVAEFVCGHVDGGNGGRLVDAVIDFVRRRSTPPPRR
jgi:hypothetical protein